MCVPNMEAPSPGPIRRLTLTYLLHTYKSYSPERTGGLFNFYPLFGLVYLP